MIIHPTTVAEYNEAISKGTVLVDFFATWCGPCKMLAPILEEIDEEGSPAQIVKVDVDQVSEPCRQLGIQAVPTLVLFKDGKRVDVLMGYQSKEDLLDFMKK